MNKHNPNIHKSKTNLENVYLSFHFTRITKLIDIIWVSFGEFVALETAIEYLNLLKEKLLTKS
jgi:hypothetical protein